MPSQDVRKRIITDFLERCNAYADERIAHYSAAFDGTTAAEALALQDKLGHWRAYLAFNEHAIKELQAGELDHWLGS